MDTLKAVMPVNKSAITLDIFMERCCYLFTTAHAKMAFILVQTKEVALVNNQLSLLLLKRKPQGSAAQIQNENCVGKALKKTSEMLGDNILFICF